MSRPFNLQTLLKSFYLLLCMSCPAQLSAQNKCAYVISKNGLKVREMPSLEGYSLHTLKFGAAVKVMGDTLDGGWIEIDSWSRNPNYVSAAFLAEKMTEIPVSSLYNINSARFGDWGLFYNRRPREYCPAYYEENKQDYSVQNDREYGIPISAEAMKLLNPREHFKLELVELDDYRDQIIESPYSIDTNGVRKYDQIHRKTQGFHLPINGGKDSVHIEDYQGEGYISREYVGEVKALNAYVISESYESTSTSLIDKTSGKQTFLVEGMPFISPNKQHILGFDHPLTYSDNDVCSVQILPYGKYSDFHFSSTFGFKSWQMFERDLVGYWVSSNELIVRVFPVGQLRGSYPRPKNRAYQYLKITIL